VRDRIAERHLEAISRDGLDLEWKVKKHPGELEVWMIVKNREEWFTQHGYGKRGLPAEMKDPGYIDGGILLLKTSADDLDGSCRDNVFALHEEVFKRGKPTVWAVGHVFLKNPKLQGKGLGKELYTRALKEVSPAIVVSDKCDGGKTSLMAERVWNSLKSKYPSKGSWSNTVLAVK
jgi:GNAT superfamily N-acetyltransferase